MLNHPILTHFFHFKKICRWDASIAYGEATLSLITPETKIVLEGRKSTKTRNWRHYSKKIRTSKTCIYIKTDLTSNFTLLKIVENESKARDLGFLHLIVTSDEKIMELRCHASTSTARLNIHKTNLSFALGNLRWVKVI